jgi:glycosidase
MVRLTAAPLPTAGQSPQDAPSPPVGSAIWQDQIIYVLIPHKFFDGDPSNNLMKRRYSLPNARYEGGFLGGDLAGVRQKIGYLKGLGITCVLFYPMMRNDAEPLGRYLAPGYRPADYHAVDPNFGTVQDLKNVVADLHASTNGAPRVNVILDLPLGMTGREHPWYRQQARFPNYYRPWNAADPTQNIGTAPMALSWGNVDNAWGMPIINHTTGLTDGTATYAALRDILYYLTDTFAVDGFRYDSAQNVDPRFWAKMLGEFRFRYARSRPDFMHLGEVFIGSPKKNWQVYQDDFMDQTVHDLRVGYIGMDGTYDFGLIAQIQKVFAAGQDVGTLVRHMDAQATYFEHPERLAASIDNYEDPTFNRKVTRGNAAAKSYLALAFLLTINRVPLLYSGNEYGIDYTQPGQLFAPSNNATYLARFKELVRLRKDHPALRRGTLRWLDRTATILSYERAYQGRRYVIVLNNSAAPQTITLGLGSRGILARGQTSILNGAGVLLNNAGTSNGSLAVTLSPYEPKIVELN